MSGQEREALRAEFEIAYRDECPIAGASAKLAAWWGFQAARAAQPAAPAVRYVPRGAAQRAVNHASLGTPGCLREATIMLSEAELPALAADGLPELSEHAVAHAWNITFLSGEKPDIAALTLALNRQLAYQRGDIELGRQQAVPQGWQLVPEKITEEMHVAAVRTVFHCTGNDDFPPCVFAAMLAAAPQAPARPMIRHDPSRGQPTIETSRRVRHEHMDTLKALHEGMAATDPEGWNPNTETAMTPGRACYFMERFKHEEKLLGPNEQAAVDFVIAMLSQASADERRPLNEETMRTFLRAQNGRLDRREVAVVRATEFLHNIKERP